MIDANTRDYVRAIVRRRLRDPQDVEDVTQDALLRAHRYRDTYRGDAAYKNWLFRVTMTAIAEHVRRQQRAGESVELPIDLAAPTCARARLAARVQLERVETVVEALGPRLEAVFWQSVRDGMTEREIAAVHGLTVPAVKARINRAKHAVRAAFAVREAQEAA